MDKLFDEKRMIDVICPHCHSELDIDDFTWKFIFDDLDEVGKSVVLCEKCGLYFLIREEDDDGPFCTK